MAKARERLPAQSEVTSYFCPPVANACIVNGMTWHDLALPPNCFIFDEYPDTSPDGNDYNIEQQKRVDIATESISE